MVYIRDASESGFVIQKNSGVLTRLKFELRKLKNKKTAWYILIFYLIKKCFKHKQKRLG